MRPTSVDNYGRKRLVYTLTQRNILPALQKTSDTTVCQSIRGFLLYIVQGTPDGTSLFDGRHYFGLKLTEFT